MKAVRVQYFAILREQRGVAEERLETEAATPADLYAALRERHGFTLSPERIRAAVNGDFVPATSALQDGDTLAFIPPVAGG